MKRKPIKTTDKTGGSKPRRLILVEEEVVVNGKKMKRIKEIIAI